MTTTTAAPKVYISYAWQGDSERVANELDADFNRRGIELIRDKRALGYKGLISEFMKDIGRGDAIVVVICDKYLKSDNCMFELLQVAHNNDLVDRIFPIVLHDADIYDAIKSVDYIKYWEDKRQELKTKLKSLDEVGHIEGLDAKLELWEDIRKGIAQLTSTLRDMNTLPPDQHSNTNFAAMIDQVEARLKKAAAAAAVSPAAATAVAAPVMPAAAAAPPPAPALVAVPGLADALEEVLDTGSSMDSVGLFAIDNGGGQTLLALLVVAEGALHLQVQEKAELAGLQLPPEAWARINRGGVAGSVRTLGDLRKLSGQAVLAEINTVLGNVFGLPDANYALQALAFDSEADEDEEPDPDADAGAYEEGFIVEGLEDELGKLLTQRGEWQVSVWADDGEQSVCLLCIVRDSRSDALACSITLNKELPPPLRMNRAARQALIQQMDFEVDGDDGLAQALGRGRETQAEALVEFVMAVLDAGFGMPREPYAFNATLETR